MKRGMIIILELILILGFASAEISVGNLSNSIASSYNPGGNITGWVNISLSNQPANSILKSSFGETINLIDLIKKTSNSGFDYTCNPLLCKSGYLANNEESSKSFSLEEDGTALFGFKLSSSGKNLVSDISNFQFSLASLNSPETEKLPLAIDILNDGQIDWQAYTASENFGSENFGCFLGVGTSQEKLTSQIYYCEKIALSKTPGVEIGGYVTYATGDKTVKFKMSIKKSDGGETKECTTGETIGSGLIERVWCIPDFQIKTDGDYFVCIKPTTGMNEYEITSEQEHPCGFTGTYDGNYDYDFEIFAKPKKYAPIGSFTLNNAELTKTKSPVTNVGSYIKNYVLTVYKNNCSNGCVIPVKIYSGVEQQIEISDASIEYIAGTSKQTNMVYEVSETPAQISTTKFQKLYLDNAGFKVPTKSGNATFKLSLNDDEFFSKKISVGKGLEADIQSLIPTRTAVKYPTKFTVEISSAGNITKYDWNFGDGGTQTSTTNSVTYTYNSMGEYTMKINVSDINEGISSGEFNITVGPASEIVPTILKETETNLANIKSQMTTFSQFEQKSLNKSLNLDGLENAINQLEIRIEDTKLKDAATQTISESEYESILGELLAIKIPKTISKTSVSDNIIFYLEESNIDLGVLKKIGGGSYETNKESAYKEAVSAWNWENTNIVLIFSEIYYIYDNYETPSLKIFDVSITKKEGDDAYLIIKDMKDLLFDESYSEKKEGGYVYINLKEPEREIVFSTTEEVNFINLPMFVSPGISKLTLAEWSPFEKEGGLKKWIIFVIIVALIILIAAILWIILQFWYKRKYENYLFKNRNNLYNLVNYIEIEKKKGTSEKDIISKLRKAGWTSEQLRYALRKYSGKRTGMIEIPIEKIFDVTKKTNGPDKKDFSKKVQ